MVSLIRFNNQHIYLIYTSAAAGQERNILSNLSRIYLALRGRVALLVVNEYHRKLYIC